MSLFALNSSLILSCLAQWNESQRLVKLSTAAGMKNISCGQNHAVQLSAISYHAHQLVQTRLGYCACTLLVMHQHQNPEIHPWRRYHIQFNTKPSLACETLKRPHQSDAMSSRQSWMQEPGCDIWTQSVFAEHMVLKPRMFQLLNVWSSFQSCQGIQHQLKMDSA